MLCSDQLCCYWFIRIRMVCLNCRIRSANRTIFSERAGGGYWLSDAVIGWTRVVISISQSIDCHSHYWSSRSACVLKAITCVHNWSDGSLSDQIVRWLHNDTSVCRVWLSSVPTAWAIANQMMFVTLERHRLAHTLDCVHSCCINASNLLNRTHLSKISPKDRTAKQVVPNFTITNLLVWIPILIPLLLQTLVVPIVGGKFNSQ